MPMLWFSLLPRLSLKLYLFFSSLGLSLSSVRLSYSRVVFLESKDRFVLSCLMCVSGKKCTGEMECEVRRGREGKREGEMKGEEKESNREKEGGKGGEAWTKASYQSCKEPITGLRQTSP